MISKQPQSGRSNHLYPSPQHSYCASQPPVRRKTPCIHKFSVRSARRLSFCSPPLPYTPQVTHRTSSLTPTRPVLTSPSPQLAELTVHDAIPLAHMATTVADPYRSLQRKRSGACQPRLRAQRVRAVTMVCFQKLSRTAERR